MPIQAEFERTAEEALQHPDAMNLLRQKALEGDDIAKTLLSLVNDSTAELIIGQAPSKLLGHLIRTYEPYWSLRQFIKQKEPEWEDVDLTPFRTGKPGSIVRNAVTYTSKSGAAFSGAIDVFFEPETYTSYSIMRRRINKELLSSHAFDKGNEKAIEWIEGERKSVAQRVRFHYEQRYGPSKEVQLMPLRGDIDSNESYFIQAADIAAGIAKHLYETGSVLEVTIHFDYVTFNGRKIGQEQASEIIKEWKQKGYY